MDLRSVLNDSGNGERNRDRDRERSTPKQPPTPQQQPHQLPQHHQQSPAAYPYREYGHHPQQVQQSPGKPPSQDFSPRSAHQPPPGPYGHPQSPYQQPNPYPGGRPAPPPLQQTNSFHDARSPTGSMPAPSPTAYRPGTASSNAPGSAQGGYPFPTQEVTSPSMRHQYPPGSYHPQQQPPQRQETFPQGPGPYAQQQPAHVTQPSPVATPGGSHPYPPQRSQSTHSTPTPTSAHNQQPYGTPYAHGSPLTTTHPPPSEYNRQPSQPPTPHGPPLSAPQRHSTGHAAYAQQLPQQQPSSPYQQRMPSVPGPQAVQTQTSPRQTHSQTPQTPGQRPSNAHDSASDHRPRLSSHFDRDSSLSVSPKTRIPSLPGSNADRKSISSEASHKPSLQPEPMAIDPDRGVTPAKRKLEDRDLSPRELERKEKRPPPGEVNGEHIPAEKDGPIIKKESSAPPRKIRTRRTEPPVWAQSIRTLGKQLPKNANFVLQKRVHSHINGGRTESMAKSRHSTPEKPMAQPTQPPTVTAPAEPAPQSLLGAWEPSITGVRPYEEISRMVADFLFLNVVNSEDMQEISSRGIKFEIEAKLGTLIDKDTNHRVERAVESEVVLNDTGRIAFRSSMTEAHHKFFNDFLNSMVVETHPGKGTGRVQVQYKHRRETDCFVELPTELQQRIPGCMRSRLGSRARNIRVRITYDQKTKDVLGMIIKARVADFDIHLPSCPMDCRISINLEMDWDGPVQELEHLAATQADRQPDRNKDRLSYTHGHYQIDLTQVTQQHQGPGNQQRLDKEHELEIELSPDILIDQGRRALSGADHRYQELVEGLVDNIRVLARKARDCQH